MKPAKTSVETTERRYLSRWLAYLCGLVIFLMPFHAFLTVWGNSLFGFYTELRLWKEVVLFVLLLGSAWLLWYYRRSFPSLHSLGRRPLIVVGVAYLLLLVIAGVIAYAAGDVNLKAGVYGLLLDVRFLLFFAVAWIVTRRSSWILDHWRGLLLVPAIIVVTFGLLQVTVLPRDFLAHFGYGPDTIRAVQRIDQKDAYPRIISTLRGANPLGTYLVLILATLGGLLLLSARFTSRKPKHQLWYAAFFAAGCVVLAFSFSRAAWIGAVLSLGFLLYRALGSGKGRRNLTIAAVAFLVAFASVGYLLRNNDVFQNTFLHTDEHSSSAESSDQGHLSATAQGVKDVVRQPLGAGTGTAGPASVYNVKPARIAENYFVQIGQEAGILGLVLFVLLNVLVARELWRRRAHTLAYVLLAALIGLTFVNLLSHAWTDDTIAYVWWGLAGAAMALPVASKARKKAES